MDKEHNEILRMSHSFLSGRAISPETIRDFIRRMSLAYPETRLDEDWLFSKLEAIHSVSIGAVRILDDMTDHEEWFNPVTNTAGRRDISFHFWDHYRDYLSFKGWPPRLIENLDRLSSEILSRIEDPLRQGNWDRRGMVMGSVQSGKTANYTALITKAADTGYKLFIVLAGVHNSLRSQTQARLNEEFLGYDLEKIQKLTGGEKHIGVRRMFDDHRAVYTLTSRNERGDFITAVAQNSGIFPSVDSPPIILIIKKNVTILRNVITWVKSLQAKTDNMGRSFIPDIPVLVIDDECDYASINTKKPEIDVNTGKINEEWNPTSINRLIRELLFLFDKSIYVGYTATPYANIFIHKDHTHEKYGEDLFPRSFIISLPQPSNYLGPERVFGLDEDTHRGVEETEPLPLIRIVDDYENIIPDKHDRSLKIDLIPDSLNHAVRSFLLSCAARAIRREGTPHNSMLIHVTRFVDVQQQVYEIVENELRNLTARIMNGGMLDDFREIWETDYLPSTQMMSALNFTDATSHSWDEIKNQLYKSTKVVRIKKINGSAKDYLDYKDAEQEAENRIQKGEDVPWEERGLSVIAVGGDKLSRGLTLEGLTISYYLRATKMYDTLMQMGRWFGYRDGYSDLCRIFTTVELLSWYRHIAGATIELREEIDYMSTLGETPDSFGLKVRSHPGQLVVTSANKSRNKVKVSLSYDGKISETVVFDPRHSQSNVKAVEGLVSNLDFQCSKEHSLRYYRWKDVPPEIVINFFRSYRTQEDAKKVVDPEILALYIEKQNKNGELGAWDVVILSNTDKSISTDIGSYKIGCMKRAPAMPITDEKISIKRLVSPADEIIDLSQEKLEAARQYDREQRHVERGENDIPSGIAIRAVRPASRGLFLIYFIHGTDRNGRKYGIAEHSVAGFAVSFPRSSNAIPVEYWVNPVWVEEENHYV